MHMLLLAANDYLGGPLPKLKFPKLDAESVRKQIETQSGELYDLGVVRTIYNQDVTRANVEAEISKLVAGDLAKVRSDDLLTVFVAGHGFAFGDEYYFVPPSVDLRSLGDAKSQAEFDEGLKTALRKDGVPWETLKRLAEVRCRKVFLLDTCYAGNIQLKSAIRPLSQKRILVISATAENKPAMEADFLGHGAFTKSFLDGLQGAADSPRKTGTDELQRRERDGRIDLDEIADFVTKNVPEFARTEEYRQTPMYSPTELFEYFVPLVTARSGAGQ